MVEESSPPARDGSPSKGTFNGKEASGAYSAAWAPGRHCLRLTAQWAGAASAQSSGIGGWSPDEKQYVEHWYASDGTSHTFRYSLGKEKDPWVGTFEQVDKDGKKGSGTIRLEKKAGEYGVSLNGTSDGKKIVVESVAKKVK